MVTQAADCYNLTAPQGHRVVVHYRHTNAQGSATSMWMRDTGGTVAFEGQQANEVVESMRLSDGADRIDIVARSYQRRTALAEITHYGADLDVSMTIQGAARTTDLRSVFEPPFVDRHYALRAGESVTQTASGRGNGTVNGVVVPEQRITTRTTMRFVGVEPVTVPAGTGNACLFEENTEGQPGSKRRWIQVGHGVTLKEVTTSASGTETKEAVPPPSQPKR